MISSEKSSVLPDQLTNFGGKKPISFQAHKLFFVLFIFFSVALLTGLIKNIPPAAETCLTCELQLFQPHQEHHCSENHSTGTLSPVSSAQHLHLSSQSLPITSAEAAGKSSVT